MLNTNITTPMVSEAIGSQAEPLLEFYDDIVQNRFDIVTCEVFKNVYTNILTQRVSEAPGAQVRSPYPVVLSRFRTKSIRNCYLGVFEDAVYEYYNADGIRGTWVPGSTTYPEVLC